MSARPSSLITITASLSSWLSDLYPFTQKYVCTNVEIFKIYTMLARCFPRARLFCISFPTKYIYIKRTTVYIPSSEFGLPPTPFFPASVPLSARNQRGGDTLACGWGVGGVPTPTTGEKLSTLPALWFSPTLLTNHNAVNESFPKPKKSVLSFIKNHFQSYFWHAVPKFWDCKEVCRERMFRKGVYS